MKRERERAKRRDICLRYKATDGEKERERERGRERERE